MDEEEIRTLDESFDAHDIPADVYWLDIEYTDRKKLVSLYILYLYNCVN